MIKEPIPYLTIGVEGQAPTLRIKNYAERLNDLLRTLLIYPTYKDIERNYVVLECLVQGYRDKKKGQSTPDHWNKFWEGMDILDKINVAKKEIIFTRYKVRQAEKALPMLMELLKKTYGQLSHMNSLRHRFYKDDENIKAFEKHIADVEQITNRASICLSTIMAALGSELYYSDKDQKFLKD